MGRPCLPKGRVKNRLLVIRVTPAFERELCAAARRADKCLTHFIRDTLTEKLERE